MGKKCLLSVMFMLLVILFSEIVFAGPSLIISEVFYDTPGTDSQEEWIELYNPTSNPIDVKDYILEDSPSGSFTISTVSRIIAPGATLIVAKNSTGFFVLYGFNPDISGMTLILANGGDFVRLRDDSAVLLDEVAWEGALPDWGGVSANTDRSIVRFSLASGPGAWLSNQTPDPGNPAPLPEPGSLILLMSGLVTMGIVRRKWKRS